MTNLTGDGLPEPAPDADQVRDARQIERELRALIDGEGLLPGERLGSERELALRFNTTRSQLRNALANLERDQLVRRVPGRTGGIFVNAEKVVRDLSNLVGVPELLQRQGYAAVTRVISGALWPCDESVGRRLGCASGEPVYDLVRLRLADGVPISLEHAYVPSSMAPGLLEQGIGGSLTDSLRDHYGVVAADVRESIEARLAEPQEAALLGISARTPLLCVERVGSTSEGLVFEYSIDLFRADKVKILVRGSGVPTTDGDVEDGPEQIPGS